MANRKDRGRATLGEAIAQKMAPGADELALRGLRALARSSEPLGASDIFGKPAPWQRRLLVLLASTRIVDGSFAVEIDATGSAVRFRCPNPRGLELLLNSGKWLHPFVEAALAQEFLGPKENILTETERPPPPSPEPESVEPESELSIEPESELSIEPEEEMDGFGWRRSPLMESCSKEDVARLERVEQMLLRLSKAGRPQPRRLLFDKSEDVEFQRRLLKDLVDRGVVERVGERFNTAYSDVQSESFLDDPLAIFECVAQKAVDWHSIGDPDFVELFPERAAKFDPPPPKPPASEDVGSDLLQAGVMQMIADLHRLLPQYLEVLQWHAQRLEAVEKRLEQLVGERAAVVDVDLSGV